MSFTVHCKPNNLSDMLHVLQSQGLEPRFNVIDSGPGNVRLELWPAQGVTILLIADGTWRLEAEIPLT